MRKGNIINIDKDEGLAISLVTEIIKPEQLSFEDSKKLVKKELTSKVQFEKAMKKAEDIKKRVKKGEKFENIARQNKLELKGVKAILKNTF